MRIVALQPDYELIIKAIKEMAEKGIVSESMQIPSIDGRPMYVARDFGKFIMTLKEWVKLSEMPRILLISPRLNLKKDEILGKIIEETSLNRTDLAFFGQHRIYKEEIGGRINLYTQREIRREGLNESCDAVMAGVKDSGALAVIVDLDIASALGFSPRELLHVLGRIRMMKNLSLLMIKDRSERNDILLKKVIYECL